LHYDRSAASIIDILNNAAPSLNLLGPLSMFKYCLSEFNYFISHLIDGHCRPINNVFIAAGCHISDTIFCLVISLFSAPKRSVSTDISIKASRRAEDN